MNPRVFEVTTKERKQLAYDRESKTHSGQGKASEVTTRLVGCDREIVQKEKVKPDATKRL